MTQRSISCAGPSANRVPWFCPVIRAAAVSLSNSGIGLKLQLDGKVGSTCNDCHRHRGLIASQVNGSLQIGALKERTCSELVKGTIHYFSFDRKSHFCPGMPFLRRK